MCVQCDREFQFGEYMLWYLIYFRFRNKASNRFRTLADRKILERV
jgi:hypothetical protein